MQRIMPVAIDDQTTKDNIAMQEQEDHGYIVFRRQNYPSDDDDDLLSTVSDLTVSTLDRYNALAMKRARSNAFQCNLKHAAHCRTCGCDPSTARCLQVPAPIPIPFFRNPEQVDCVQSLKRKRDEALSDTLLENRLAFLKSSNDLLHSPCASGRSMKRSCKVKGDLGFQEVGVLGQELMTQELSVEIIYMEHQALTAIHKRPEYSSLDLVPKQSDCLPFPAFPVMLKVPNPLEPETIAIPAVIQVCMSPPGLAALSDSDDVSELGLDDQVGSPFEHLSIQPVEAGVDDQCVEKILDIIPSTLPPQPRSIAVLVTPSID